MRPSSAAGVRPSSAAMEAGDPKANEATEARPGPGCGSRSWSPTGVTDGSLMASGAGWGQGGVHDAAVARGAVESGAMIGSA